MHKMLKELTFNDYYDHVVIILSGTVHPLVNTAITLLRFAYAFLKAVHVLLLA